MSVADTITAVATPPGTGGVSVIRISGPDAGLIARGLTGQLPVPRRATLLVAKSQEGERLDQGLGLFFPRPNSFTGEDVFEFHGHGGAVVTDLVLSRVMELGARQAQPGEFSRRAYLNGKLDLVQAEAVADLISAGSRQAVRSAQKSLQGEFSGQISRCMDWLTRIRVHMEASLDFVEEEIDPRSQEQLLEDTRGLADALASLLQKAELGNQIREGAKLILVGAPNVGKSSLMNALTGKDSAIVTDIPGTTRDLIREQILLAGISVELVDTAGLRTAGVDPVEQEGINRARSELAEADHILYVTDLNEYGSPQFQARFDALVGEMREQQQLTLLVNKLDLADSGLAPPLVERAVETLWVSARTGAGLDVLKQRIRNSSVPTLGEEGVFSARRRHVTALQTALRHCRAALAEYEQTGAGELLAEELLLAQNALGEITGQMASDDLLGAIFSTFCIGK